MNKKGNINELLPAVMAIILIGALLFVGILVVSNFATVAHVSTAVSVVNESAPGVVKEAGQTLASTYRDAVCSSVTNCFNQTNSILIAAANYTVTGCKVAYSGATDSIGVNNTIWKCSYAATYNADSASSTAMDSVNTSLGTLATTWLPIIVVVIAAGIVLAILLGAFGGKKK